MADVLSQSQFIREAPEIEAQKLGLLESAKAQVDATNLAGSQGRFLTPNYQIAGMSGNQLNAIRGGQEGIGAYQPYMTNAANQLGAGQQAVNTGVDVLRSADTRNQYNAAQGLQGVAAQGTYGAAQPIGQQQISQYMNPFMNLALQGQLSEMGKTYFGSLPLEAQSPCYNYSYRQKYNNFVNIGYFANLLTVSVLNIEDSFALG